METPFKARKITATIFRVSKAPPDHNEMAALTIMMRASTRCVLTNNREKYWEIKEN